MANKILDKALELAAIGFYIFPVKPGGKTPAFIGWQDDATRDERTLRQWFEGANPFNIGIFTGRFGDDGEALVVVDEDNKEGKAGGETILALALDGIEFPATRIHTSPTGGRHHIYRYERPVKQGTNVLGDGLDIRSRGGYVVGPESRVEAGVYGDEGGLVQRCPDWIVARCGDGRTERKSDRPASEFKVDTGRALARGRFYLENDCPVATTGGRNDAGFKAAAYLKDIGINEADTLALMAEAWRCEPPLDDDELAAVVASAYNYGQEKQGSAAPEADFTPVAQAPLPPGMMPAVNPFEQLNKSYAYVTAGGGDHILHETTDSDGRAVVEHMDMGTFHRKHLPDTVTLGKKEVQITEEWMRWKGRRAYDGIVFSPEKPVEERFYNLWQGFSVSPLDRDPTPEEQWSLDAFLEHALENVCNGNFELCNWLMAYFAHMIQKPWEKPLVALVFKGSKGVGKNALVERVGNLFGDHFMVADDDRYLLSNFNDHLESCLCLVLDEAAWAGDKKAEGRLKGLITGTKHNIEPKGEKAYKVKNLTRVMFLGNEDWVVPASHDERRFAVFNVGSGRKQDMEFFERMRVAMEGGGYRLLLKYLREFDLTGINLNRAPSTEGLLEQKQNSMEPLEQWWFDNLNEGRLVASDFGDKWPLEIERDRLRESFRRRCKDRSVRSRLPSDVQFGRMLFKFCPQMQKIKINNGAGYKFPSLAKCRELWDDLYQQKNNWDEQ